LSGIISVSGNSTWISFELFVAELSSKETIKSVSPTPETNNFKILSPCDNFSASSFGNVISILFSERGAIATLLPSCFRRDGACAGMVLLLSTSTHILSIAFDVLFLINTGITKLLPLIFASPVAATSTGGKTEKSIGSQNSIPDFDSHKTKKVLREKFNCPSRP